MRPRDLSLRTRLVLAFVGVVALTAVVSAALTTWGLHASLDDYLRDRAQTTGQQAVATAERTYRDSGGAWTERSLDLLAHDLAVSGYDYRLSTPDGTVILDTTKSAPDRRIEQVFSGHVLGPDRTVVAQLEAFAFPAAVRTPADDQFARELDRLHLLAALLAAVAAALVGVATAGWLTRPMRELSGMARSLADRSGAEVRTPPGPPELRQVGDALSRLATDLERQRSARLQLAQDLAHELRTPVMLIQSRLEAMEDGIVPVDERALESLHATVLRLGRLIGEIEMLAEAGAEPRELARQPLRLDEAAQQAAMAITGAMQLREIQVELNLVPVSVDADPDALDRIITNLLTNAAKYAPARSRVGVATSLSGDVAVLTVTDEGGELTGPEGARAFERFYRGPQARASGEGFGLGLTIARQLAEEMGGTLSLDARPERTTFRLHLRRGGQTGHRPPEHEAVRAARTL